ncbi:NAD(P)-binding domain-containing protein [Paraburkholderia phytofirmans]|uniref:NAD(P)-binding domain-containing protein n=1 Tax=Paraburkholderia phytofirmans TaxID=261302 RepID=UPI0038B9E7D3
MVYRFRTRHADRSYRCRAGGTVIRPQGCRCRAQHFFRNSHGPYSRASLAGEFGPLACEGTLRDAVNHLVVLLTLSWPRVETVLRKLPPWRGQILIDSINGFGAGNRPSQILIRSSNEIIQQYFVSANQARRY